MTRTLIRRRVAATPTARLAVEVDGETLGWIDPDAWTFSPAPGEARLHVVARCRFASATELLAAVEAIVARTPYNRRKRVLEKFRLRRRSLGKLAKRATR